MKKILFASTLALLAWLSVHAELEFAPGGGFVEGGVPVQLIGTLIYELPSAKDYRPFPGEPAGWEWLYETPPNRAQFNRIGFNATGTEVPTTWMRKYRPEANFWQGGRKFDWTTANGYIKNGLPVWVDYTCASWSQGGISYDPKRPPAAEAFTKGDCHFMSYSLVTKEGLGLFTEMWQSGARELLENGVKPFVYELFNEPSYDDRSPAAEEAFKQYLEKCSVPKNPVAEFVARRKFNQKCFANAIRRGKVALREVDPEARTCFQPLQSSSFYICADIDLYAANRTTDLVVAPTGGGDAWDALLLLAVAEKRPIVDGEAYPGSTRASHRARILTEYARGLNGTYYFKWDRRPNSYLWKEKDGPARLAEQFPYCALNPASVPPEAFAGLKDAAGDIASVNDLFTPRNRGITNSIAVLVSQPTIRLCAAEKRSDALQMREAGECLLAARLPVKAIFEEQLDTDHLEGIKVLVAAGIDATLDKTNKRLRQWVKKGGILVVINKKLDRNEWGETRQDALVPQLANSAYGKGRIIYVERTLAPSEARDFYSKIAAKLGILPSCRLTEALNGAEVPEVACYAAQKESGSAGFILFNEGLSPRAVRLLPVGVGAAVTRWVDVTTKAEVPRSAKGELLLKLLPGIPVVLRGGAAADKGQERGGRDSVPYQAEATFLASVPAWVAANSGANLTTAPYWTELDSVSFVNLRQVANGALEDVVASIPWGRQMCAGIPFDFIRIDQNGNRSGVCLDKPVSSVPVEGAARTLDFLFTAPKDAKGALFACELAYADGQCVTLTFSTPEDTRYIGWSNRQGAALYAIRKMNPRPNAALSSLTFKSAAKGVWLAAVTAEKPAVSPSLAAFQGPNLSRVGSWGGHKVEVTDEGLLIKVVPNAPDWSGVGANLKKSLAVTADDIANRSLVLDIALVDGAKGSVPRPLRVPQFQFNYRTAKGEEKRGGYICPGGSIESGVWRTVRIPLRRLLPAEAAEVTRLSIQFLPFAAECADYRFRAIRFE